MSRHGKLLDPAIDDFGGGDANQFGFRRQITGVLHPQRLIDLPRDKLFQRFAADALSDFPEQKIVDIAVPKSRPRGALQLFFASFLNRRLLPAPIAFGLDIWTEA